PSWCEAHHIKHWDRDNGPTNIDNGILLCRRHHLLLHDNHWEIINTNNNYWLQPPTTIDPTQTLIPLPSKTPTITTITRKKAS
ncbi:HNH endonuclease, partial [Marisediminicola antarctica]